MCVISTSVYKWATHLCIMQTSVGPCGSHVHSHLLLSEHLLDADGLHGGEGLSPFQKALRDRRYLFSRRTKRWFKTLRVELIRQVFLTVYYATLTRGDNAVNMVSLALAIYEQFTGISLSCILTNCY